MGKKVGVTLAGALFLLGGCKAALRGSIAAETSIAPVASEGPVVTDEAVVTEVPATADSATTLATTPPITTPPAPAETVSQEMARRKAAEYLQFSSFSRKGLIDQVMFEGFSEADATYGVDAQFADWNAQAALKAAEYLELMSFSHRGLVDQLVFEGFTPEQAEYGVSTTGL